MFKFSIQHDIMDCAPTCLKMVAEFYGKSYSMEYLRELCHLGKNGVSLLSISEASETLGFRSLMVKLNMQKLINDCPLPCILHWNQEHFVVLLKIKRKGNFIKRIFHKQSYSKVFVVADPAHGIVKLDEETFYKAWVSTYNERGVALLLEPTPTFYNAKEIKEKQQGLKFLFHYLQPFKRHIAQLVIGMLAASLISLTLPFTTQILLDQGVSEKSLSVVHVILLAQLFLIFGNMSIELVRSWLLLHINSRISLSIISDFLSKLLKLPIRYFDSKAVGDIAQRINDHHRIENFLTGSVLTSLFSFVNIIVFTIVLAVYNLKILSLFVAFSFFGIIWILLFQKKRKEMDYKRFSRSRENQDKLYELITGMQEIKLFGSETPKRWEWEQLQVKDYKLNIKSLALEQYQRTGLIFVTHVKNILITFIAATEAIKGNLTIGQLLSISYIIGQTSGPIEQLVNLIRAAQDAKLSMSRLQEIHNKQDEEAIVKNKILYPQITLGDLFIENVSFQYEGPNSPYVLKNINLRIPKGKVTAIVGTSGSGKTTLMKILLNFYQPTQGRVLVGNSDLNKISPKLWRSHCGSVMQDGYIFYDTIAKNIAMDGGDIDEKKMEMAIRVANLQDFIESTPNNYTTKIGLSGMGISGGQRQRILIARSVYKNPEYIFFDEATSSLDANNEKVIIDYLNEFFRDKTVVIIAHRLSTVKKADQIIVLNDGKIEEIGNHSTLISNRGRYYELVKNQLELGN
ncbi:peptidase domain-containing ABC transporter [Sphingobacterium zeae]|uniref:ATP-binding cassette subfamily B protein n=1 Tax=Sphingobacterium zeae TaxID=1776859 RepID=A0ABU0U2T3_9SPHI|nr:peptidase domain-containing ABC transporter [Sphingobacterium zeae]MDQ1149269.1 ATP-binding cassette subfamily B protein [Sphingobacterium zeae]